MDLKLHFMKKTLDEPVGSYLPFLIVRYLRGLALGCKSA